MTNRYDCQCCCGVAGRPARIYGKAHRPRIGGPRFQSLNPFEESTGTLKNDLLDWRDLSGDVVSPSDQHGSNPDWSRNGTWEGTTGPDGRAAIQATLTGSSTRYWKDDNYPYGIAAGTGVTYNIFFKPLSAWGNDQVCISHRGSSSNAPNMLQSKYKVSTGKMQATFWDQLGTLKQLNVTMTQDVWHMVTITFDVTSKYLAMYIDGTLGDSLTHDGSSWATSASMRFMIGRATHSTSASNLSRAGFRNYGRWGRALTTDEITSLYNSGAGLIYSEL